MAKDAKGRFMKGHNLGMEIKRSYTNCLYCDKKIRTFKSRSRKFCGHSCSLKYSWKNNFIKKNVAWNKGTKVIMKSNQTSFQEGDSRIIKENNPNWKGGITTLNKLLRNSSKWKIWREFIFLRDNFTCQNKNCEFCNNKIGVLLHPHHIKQLSEFPELAFKIDNGITYCAEYHLKSGLHRRKQMQKEC